MAVHWIEVAVIGRPHGLKGALHVRMLNPESGILAPGLALAAVPEVAGRQPQAQRPADTADIAAGGEQVIEWCERRGDHWVVKFRGVDQREVASALTNQRLHVRRTDLPGLDDNELYQADLVGMMAQRANGEILGTILGFFSNGAHEVCTIRTTGGGEALIPFHDSTVIEVDEEQGHVVVDVPEGIPGLDDGE